MSDEPDRIDAQFVGRERELGILEDAWRIAKSGRSRVVLVGGTIGIGKSMFVRRFLDRHADAQVFACTCLDLESPPPLSLWHELCFETERVANAVFPGRGDIDGLGDAATDRIVAWLIHVIDSLPTILFVDDLHWADADSITLLRRVALRLRHVPLLIIATYRDNEREPTSPFHFQIPALLRETDATQVVLPPLDEKTTRYVISQSFPLTPVDLERLTDYMQCYAQGNPLATNELLNALQREGILGTGDGVNSHWRLGDLSRVIVPPISHSIVDGLVARAGDDGKALLEVGTVFGYRVRASQFTLWRELAGLDDAAFRRAIDRSIAVGMLAEEADGTIRFAHPLARESLVKTLAGSRRIELHRQIGEHLSQAAAPEIEEVAHHLFWGRHPQALDWLLRAAERAQQRGDWSTAALRLEEASSLARVIDGHAQAAGWMIYRAAVLLRFTDLSRAINLLESARTLALDIGDATLSAGTRYHLGFLKCWNGQITAGVREMAAAIYEIESLSQTEFESLQLVESFGSRERGEHRGTLIGWYALTGRYREAIELSTPFVESSGDGSYGQPKASRHPIADGYAGRAASLAMLGQPDQAIVLFEYAQQTFAAVGNNVQVGWTCLAEFMHVVTPYASDNRVRRDWLFTRMIEMDATDNLPGGVRLADIATMFVNLNDGDWHTAREAADRVYASEALRWIAAPVLAELAVHNGDSEAFSRIIVAALPAGPATEPGSKIYTTSLRLMYLSVLDAMFSGDADGVAAWVEALERWIAWSGSVVGRAELAIARGIQAIMAGSLKDVEVFARDAIQHSLSPRRPATLATAKRTLAFALLMRGRISEAHSEIESALTIARHCHNLLEEGLCLLLLSRIQGQLPSAQQAQKTREAAMSILTGLGSVAWLSYNELTEARTQPVTLPALTRRETEVMQLVANGLTDAEIAGTLDVSRRTVTTHLSSIYAKLQVSSRAAATRIVVERGLI